VSITFDGATRTIQIGGGQFSVEAQEIYSAWKDWTLAGNAQFLPAFRSIGGDPLGGGVQAGAYYFLNNVDGWRIRPESIDHELVVSGNLYGENPLLPVFIPAIGDFQVLVRLAVSSLTQQVSSGSGLSTEQAAMLSELWKRLGLDPANPLVATTDQITVDDIVINLSGDGVTTSTAARQP
jgi:hypothetical protein